MNELINQLREENQQLKKDVKMHRDAEAEWEKLMMRLVGEDGLDSVAYAINHMQMRLRNQDAMVTASLGVSGKIKKAAFDLGYHGSLGVDELDYIIELARSASMVNQRNFELTKQIESLKGGE